MFEKRISTEPDKQRNLIIVHTRSFFDPNEPNKLNQLIKDLDTRMLKEEAKKPDLKKDDIPPG